MKGHTGESKGKVKKDKDGMEDATKEVLARYGKLVAKGLQNGEDGPKRRDLASLPC